MADQSAFYQWLIEHAAQNASTVKYAKEFLTDISFPQHADSLKELCSYARRSGGPVAVTTIRLLWAMFEDDRKEKKSRRAKTIAEFHLSGHTEEEKQVACRKIRAVLKEHPILNPHGWVLNKEKGDSPESRKVRLKSERVRMLTDDFVEQFLLAEHWLGFVRPTKAANRHNSSYGYKHDVESYFNAVRKKAGVQFNNYVSNGMFICAALAGGFEAFDLRPGSLNVAFNFSGRDLRQLRQEARAQPAGDTTEEFSLAK
jgi:uncharacterized protein YozE (UPF0346 family)